MIDDDDDIRYNKLLTFYLGLINQINLFYQKKKTI